MIHVEQLDKATVTRWLLARDGMQQELFRQARAVRRENGDDSVMLRGVIEISNYCEKRCNYCAMRACNPVVERYRMTPEQILAVAREIKSQNIGTVFLQSGQDRHCDAMLEEVIPEIKNELKMDVLLCLGERPKEVYQRWVELGANSYILKFETSQPQFYHDIAHVWPDRRVQCIRAIREVGLKLGTGNIVGLPGQTLESVVDDFFFAISLQPDFVSVAPFIPNEDTPFEGAASGDLDLALNLMALWRIALPASLIPSVSALEKLRPGGQLLGLGAGANVITINFTPEACRAKYAIYSEQRFVVSLKHALNTIHRAGLRVRSDEPAMSAA